MAGGPPRRGFVLLLASALAAPGSALAHRQHGEPAGQRLPALGPAPDFALTREDGRPFTRHDIAGKVSLVTFIYTSCGDICPLLTDKLVGIQQKLGDAFGRDIVFVSITVDPEIDRPDVLEAYAGRMGCDPRGWAHLTGSVEAIAAVARGYGVVFVKEPDGRVAHNALTSLVDRGGQLRVQYMGTAFDPDEMERDLRQLATESAPA